MIGILIKELRMCSRISLEQLSDGICSAGMLKKYESGEKWPDILVAAALWQRLGKSMDKFDVFLDQDEYNLALARVSIQEQIRCGKFREAAAGLAAYHPKKGAGQSLHHAFVYLQWADLYRLSGAESGLQEQAILTGLAQTIREPIHFDIMKKRRFCVLELLLLERYALFLEEKSPEKALRWYYALKEYFDQEDNNTMYDNADKYKLMPPVLYRLSLSLFRGKLYQNALELARKACEMLTQLKSQGALFAKIKQLELDILEEKGQPAPACEPECLRLMLEAVGSSREQWLADCYPGYTEYFLHSVNRLIHDRRRIAGLSAAEFASDLCDVRTLSAIESGRQMAQTKNKTALLKRLGLSTWKFDGGLITWRYSDFRKISALSTADYKKDYNLAKQLYRELVDGLDQSEVTNYQFSESWRLRLEYHTKKITKKKYHAELRSLLVDTLQDTGCGGRGESILTWNEREMLGILAWSPIEEETDEIQELLEGQYKRFTEEPALAGLFPNHFNTLLYCLGKHALTKNNLILSKYYLDTALNQMYYRKNDFRWSSLLFQRFRLEEAQNSIKNTENLAQEKSHVPDNEKYFRYLRYSYAINKLYLKDTINMNFIERYIQNHYGNPEEILYGLT